MIRRILGLTIILFSLSAPAKVLPPLTPMPGVILQPRDMAPSTRIYPTGGGEDAPWDAKDHNPRLTCTRADPAYCADV